MRLKIRHLEKKIIVYGTLAAALTALLLAPAYAGAGWISVGTILSLTMAELLAIYVLFDLTALRLIKAMPVGESEEPRLYQIVGDLSCSACMPMPLIAILPGPTYRVFMTGIARNRTILFISRGLQETLNNTELGIVLGHELESIDELGWFPYNVVMRFVSLLTWPVKRIVSWVVLTNRSGMQIRQDEHILIENAAVSDVPAAVKLLLAHGMYSVVYLNDLSRLAEEASPLFLAARYDGKPAGFLVGEIARRRSGKAGHVLKIVVNRRYQRKGIGDCLMRAFADVAAEAGCKSCFIEVRTDNAGAISLYRKHAFVEEKVVPGYYPDGTGCQIMVKAL
ncbi:GNAT family N-acetyltransferase [Methanocella sp. MCL-LM]|uniref:GNAT family N-acetyltransferase n=1 Tax=Methanocella sp. MCL-LM TaxID=3412035 RepID=UPI003C77D0DE